MVRVNGSGDGNGNGYGHGSGYGDGYGNGDGNGNGDGDGYGYGDGYGDGNGDGNGNGNGNGNGYGYGYGYGGGNGYGYRVDPKTPYIAWHFVNPNGMLRFPHNGEKIIVYPGLVLECDEDKIEMCSYGLHASFEKTEAARYHQGLLCKVACSGRVKLGDDKLVCSRREVIEVIEQ